MIEKKHTAMKWRVNPDPDLKGRHPLHDSRYVTTDHHWEDGRHPGEWQLGENGEGSVICKLMDLSDQRACANLIAAAPELLETVKFAARSLLEMGCDCNLNDDGTHEERCSGMQLARPLWDLIDKAEGRS